MNQATKTQIEADAEKFAEVIQTKKGTISRLNAISWYSAGATKYVELLEQEKAKGEKLVEALIRRIEIHIETNDECVDNFNMDAFAKGLIGDEKRFLNEIIKALTEYKK